MKKILEKLSEAKGLAVESIFVGNYGNDMLVINFTNNSVLLFKACRGYGDDLEIEIMEPCDRSPYLLYHLGVINNDEKVKLMEQESEDMIKKAKELRRKKYLEYKEEFEGEENGKIK